MDLCAIDLQVHSKEPLIGHINFNDVRLIEKRDNHKVIKTTTFMGYPIIVFLQGNIVTNVIID